MLKRVSVLHFKAEAKYLNHRNESISKLMINLFKRLQQIRNVLKE